MIVFECRAGQREAFNVAGEWFCLDADVTTTALKWKGLSEVGMVRHLSTNRISGLDCGDHSARIFSVGP